MIEEDWDESTWGFIGQNTLFRDKTKLYKSSANVTKFGLPKSLDYVPDAEIRAIGGLVMPIWNNPRL